MTVTKNNHIITKTTIEFRLKIKIIELIVVWERSQKIH